MLQRPEGATIDEVASAMGWRRHAVRGLFSETLKKKLGSPSPRSSRPAASVRDICSGDCTCAGRSPNPAVPGLAARYVLAKPVGVCGTTS